MNSLEKITLSSIAHNPCKFTKEYASKFVNFPKEFKKKNKISLLSYITEKGKEYFKKSKKILGLIGVGAILTTYMIYSCVSGKITAGLDKVTNNMLCDLPKQEANENRNLYKSPKNKKGFVTTLAPKIKELGFRFDSKGRIDFPSKNDFRFSPENKPGVPGKGQFTDVDLVQSSPGIYTLNIKTNEGEEASVVLDENNQTMSYRDYQIHPKTGARKLSYKTELEYFGGLDRTIDEVRKEALKRGFKVDFCFGNKIVLVSPDPKLAVGKSITDERIIDGKRRKVKVACGQGRNLVIKKHKIRSYDRKNRKGKNTESYDLVAGLWGNFRLEGRFHLKEDPKENLNGIRRLFNNHYNSLVPTIDAAYDKNTGVLEISLSTGDKHQFKIPNPANYDVFSSNPRRIVISRKDGKKLFQCALKRNEPGYASQSPSGLDNKINLYSNVINVGGVWKFVPLRIDCAWKPTVPGDLNEILEHSNANKIPYPTPAVSYNEKDGTLSFTFKDNSGTDSKTYSETIRLNPNLELEMEYIGEIDSPPSFELRPKNGGSLKLSGKNPKSIIIEPSLVISDEGKMKFKVYAVDRKVNILL